MVGRVKYPDLTHYNNFWLIWLSTIDKPRSLFEIQMEWGIHTNDLYHPESSHGKSIAEKMTDEDYITKEGSKLKANLGWLPAFIDSDQCFEISNLSKRSKIHPLLLNLALFIRKNWHKIQKFIEENREILFDMELLKEFFYENRKTAGERGREIPIVIFSAAMLANVKLISQIAFEQMRLGSITGYTALGKTNGVYYVDALLERLGDKFPKIIRDIEDMKEAVSG